MASSSIRRNDTYAAIHLMPLFNVGDKFLTKSTLHSPTFSCSEDPLQTSFRIEVEFKESQIHVLVKTPNRKVTIHKADFKLFDEDMTPRDSAPGFSNSFWRLRDLNHTFSRPSANDDEDLNELKLFVGRLGEFKLRHERSFKAQTYRCRRGLRFLHPRGK